MASGRHIWEGIVTYVRRLPTRMIYDTSARHYTSNFSCFAAEKCRQNLTLSLSLSSLSHVQPCHMTIDTTSHVGTDTNSDNKNINTGRLPGSQTFNNVAVQRTVQPHSLNSYLFQRCAVVHCWGTFPRESSWRRTWRYSVPWHGGTHHGNVKHTPWPHTQSRYKAMTGTQSGKASCRIYTNAQLRKTTTTRTPWCKDGLQ